MKSNERMIYGFAEEWLNRTHIGRTSEEKQAYLEALDSVGIDEEIYTRIYDLFFKVQS